MAEPYAHPEVLVSTEWVSQHLDDPAQAIVEVNTELQTGYQEGHVPGAVHLEWFNLMDRETHQFKSAGDIRRILNEHGITPDKNVYTY